MTDNYFLELLSKLRLGQFCFTLAQTQWNGATLATEKARGRPFCFMLQENRST